MSETQRPPNPNPIKKRKMENDVEPEDLGDSAAEEETDDIEEKVIDQVVVSLVGGPDQVPTLMISGNVPQERAVVLLSLAAQDLQLGILEDVSPRYRGVEDPDREADDGDEND